MLNTRFGIPAVSDIQVDSNPNVIRKLSTFLLGGLAFHPSYDPAF